MREERRGRPWIGGGCLWLKEKWKTGCVGVGKLVGGFPSFFFFFFFSFSFFSIFLNGLLFVSMYNALSENLGVFLLDVARECLTWYFFVCVFVQRGDLNCNPTFSRVINVIVQVNAYIY